MECGEVVVIECVYVKCKVFVTKRLFPVYYTASTQAHPTFGTMVHESESKGAGTKS